MRILLRAYTQLNLGDDLFLHILTKRYPDVEFVLASETGDMYSKFIKEHPNITVFPGHSLFYRIARRMGRTPLLETKILNKVDAVVYIGGSIFMENEDDRFYEKLIMAETSYCAAKGIPYHIISCNFGPYKTGGYRNRMRRCFERCTEVCFRDSASYKQFDDVSSARVAPDAAFSCDIERPPVREGVLGIAPISYENRKEGAIYAEKYVTRIAKQVKEHIENGGTAEIFCFCRFEGDCTAADMLMEKLAEYASDGRLTAVVYEGELEEFVKRYISCEKIIASRFHGILLALIYNIALIPHIYSKKTEEVMRDIGIYDGIDYESFKIYELPREYTDDVQKTWLNFDKLYKKI